MPERARTPAGTDHAEDDVPGAIDPPDLAADVARMARAARPTGAERAAREEPAAIALTILRFGS